MTDAFHHAFRQNFPGVIPAVITPAAILRPSLLKETNRTAFNYQALWDTGAMISAVTVKVATALNLQPSGKMPINGVHGQQLTNWYIVDIGLPNRVLFNNVSVIECCLSMPKGIPEVDVIVGMDLIQMGDFSISNPTMPPPRKTVFSFCVPSHKNPVDLLEKSNRVNPHQK